MAESLEADHPGGCLADGDEGEGRQSGGDHLACAFIVLAPILWGVGFSGPREQPTVDLSKKRASLVTNCFLIALGWPRVGRTVTVPIQSIERSESVGPATLFFLIFQIVRGKSLRSWGVKSV